MCNRRNKPICQGAVFLALLGGLGYSVYLYSIVSMDLEISKSETQKYIRQQESLSSQLQVVYEHRARLERSLQKEKTDHKNTKLDFSKKQNDFILNVTRSKHEAMNRFNSLETQYNMLMAQNKELNTDYNRLQQQYTRLSSEQSQLNNQLKRNFQLYKEQKGNEIASLDEEIKTMKQQVVSLRTHLKSRADEVEQYKSSSSQALFANKKSQESIRTLQEQLASYKEKLRELQLRLDESEKDVKHDKGRKPAEPRQKGGRLEHSIEGEVDQKQNKKPHQERESLPGPSRSDSRHPAKDISQERYHGQTIVPTALSNYTDSEDENNNEQKRDAYRHSDQRHDNTPLRSSEESKRNENSQRDSEQRHDDVPLKDSTENIRRSDSREPAVHVVAPTEISMNKWANIIKAAQQGNAPEEEKTEDNNKGGEKDGEKEDNDNDEEEEGEKEKNEEGRSRRSVDEYTQSEDSDMQRYNQNQAAKQIGMPVAQPGQESDVRLDEPGYHSDNAQRARDQYEHRRPEHQQQEVNDNNEEEDYKRSQDDLSRKNINKQIAEMQQQYGKKQIKQQQQQEVITIPPEQGDDMRQRSAYRQVAPIPAVQHRQDNTEEQQQQQQQEVITLPPGQGDDMRQRSAYRQVAPIPAVQHRQDTEEEHKEQSDADNDDEDADTEDDTEQDPDDVDEDDGAQDSPLDQLQLPYQGQEQARQRRTYDRTLKSAESNYEQKQK